MESIFGFVHSEGWGLAILRIGLGLSFIVHGTQKLSMWKAQPSAQMPAGMLSILRLLSIVEPLGGAALVLGFLTQFAAVGVGIIMLGAIRLKAIQMQKKFSESAGWELDFVLLAGAITLVLLGGGQYSLDHFLFHI